MATPKTWTATDVQQGKLTIHKTEDAFGQPALQLERRYSFVDASGQVIETITGGRLIVTVPVADIPANILSALQTIDQWSYTQILIQEGMS